MRQLTFRLVGGNAENTLGLKHGWRSGLEKAVAVSLNNRGVSYEYEQHKLKYLVPERQATYTPDFYVTTKSGKLIIIETKGRFVTADRQKMLLVKEQHPALDIVWCLVIQTVEYLKNQKQPMPLGAISTAFNGRLKTFQRIG